MVSSLKYCRFRSYIWSITATSFRSVTLCFSSSPEMRSTLTSAVAKRLFISSALIFALRNRPAMPFFSGSSIVLSSTRSPESIVPISPRSPVLTLASAVSEKSAMFFCADAPYSKICCAFSRSICFENARTACCSGSESAERSGPASGAACAFVMRSSSFLTSGCGCAFRSGVRVSWGMYSSIVCSSCICK